MTIEKKFNDRNLTLIVSGRLDTNTSPELEKTVENIGSDVGNLTLDLKDLEYISSAGLRVVLQAHKIMTKQGILELINVPDAIKEIFEMTGFSEVLNIQ